MAERPQDLLRADAQQNRDRILDVARTALAVSGDASLNSIAKKAGVGAGTLYRHFPNREALVLAVYRYDVQQLADAAPELLRDHPPLDALRLWLDRLAHDGMVKHGLAGALHAATSDGLARETYEPIACAITLLLTACADEGSIRPGFDPDDILLVLGFLWRIDPAADARVGRLLDLILDGLRGGAPGPPDRATLRRQGHRRSRPRPRQLTKLSFSSLLKSGARIPRSPSKDDHDQADAAQI